MGGEGGLSPPPVKGRRISRDVPTHRTILARIVELGVK
jgi:hypothetical protein